MFWLDHVGIATETIAPVRDFFGTHFGMLPREDEVPLPGRAATVQFLAADGGSAPGPSLELLAPSDPGDTTMPLGRFLGRRGSRIHHICLATDDIRTELARLKAAGVRLADEEPWLSPHGWAAYLHPASAFGVAVELRQHTR